MAISARATDILPGGDPQEAGDLLILATWPSGPSPVVSLGGHVSGDFDLGRIHPVCQAPPGLKLAFSEAWFTQSSGERQDPASYAGAGGFYPSGRVIPIGVVFRGELDLASVIGSVLAARLGYTGGRTVSIQGSVPVGNAVTIYNDVLVVQNDFSLQGRSISQGSTVCPSGSASPATRRSAGR